METFSHGQPNNFGIVKFELLRQPISCSKEAETIRRSRVFYSFVRSLYSVIADIFNVKLRQCDNMKIQIRLYAPLILPNPFELFNEPSSALKLSFLKWKYLIKNGNFTRVENKFGNLQCAESSLWVAVETIKCRGKSIRNEKRKHN